MTNLAPALAPVRPRVSDNDQASRLLEELVEEHAEESPSGVLWLVGESGAGKSTALSHLAAVFEGDSHYAFLDDADDLDESAIRENFETLDTNVFVVASRCTRFRSSRPQLSLEPWGVDELLEYLMVENRPQCGEVMKRLGDEASLSWMPELARIVLDQLLNDSELQDIEAALLAFLAQELPSARQMSAARRYCLALQIGGSQVLLSVPKLLNVLPQHVLRVLRHHSVQVRLAAEQIAKALSSWRSVRVLEQRIPRPLVVAVGRLCRDGVELSDRVESILGSPRHSKSHAMAASILLASDPQWRPEGKRTDKDFSGAHFAGAKWKDICLAGLPMQLADLCGAELEGASFDQAILVEADFVEADLRKASLEKILAVGASFDHANLRRASLRQAALENARLVGADLAHGELCRANLCRADLTDASFHGAELMRAILVGANLSNVNLTKCDLCRADARRVDFRTVVLAETNMELAWLNGANFEDVQWNKARLHKAGLRGAHMTVSRLPAADLREADLSGAGLGEIDWENVDLRGASLSGATFHMGSSRCGLVDSPIASEGSRTGFYTDELEELYFKSPEEVRKANLRGADLRGANIENVDFYLVDLRDAKLDPSQRIQARRTGAILSQ